MALVKVTGPVEDATTPAERRRGASVVTARLEHVEIYCPVHKMTPVAKTPSGIKCAKCAEAK